MAKVLALREFVEKQRDEIKAVAARHKAQSFAVFGSVARGDVQEALASILGHKVVVVSLGLPRDDVRDEGALPLACLRLVG